MKVSAGILEVVECDEDEIAGEGKSAKLWCVCMCVCARVSEREWKK